MTVAFGKRSRGLRGAGPLPKCSTPLKKWLLPKQVSEQGYARMKVPRLRMTLAVTYLIHCPTEEKAERLTAAAMTYLQ